MSFSSWPRDANGLARGNGMIDSTRGGVDSAAA
jgi:hypothetical protein